jgi:c-di-GMP-binding flagellar brake protein YcgR
VEHGGKVRCGLAFSEIADDERREIQRYIQQNLG